jgi:hypothetical protein
MAMKTPTLSTMDARRWVNGNGWPRDGDMII